MLKTQYCGQQRRPDLDQPLELSMLGPTRFIPLLILPLALPLPVDSQPLLEFMPEAVQQIRREQLEAAHLADLTEADIAFNDAGMRSVTGLHGVPLPFRDLLVGDEQDLIDHIEALYPLFGFRGTETLRFSAKHSSLKMDGEGVLRYRFIQYISDIQTSIYIVFEVFEASGEIRRIEGAPALDRSFPRSSIVSESDAIRCGLEYIRAQGWEDAYQVNGAHRAEKVLDWEGRTLEPWLHVWIAPKDPALDQTLFLVSPSEKVFPTSRSNHAPYREIGLCASGSGRWVPLAN
jgi:hypothetical protein